MSISKKLVFGLVLGAFLAFVPFLAKADGGRYFVKSNKGFWKNALGVRHNFEDGFTTEASDFQLRFAKIFGVSVEPVGILQILPDNPEGSQVSNPRSSDSGSGDIEAEPSPTPEPTKDQSGSSGSGPGGGIKARANVSRPLPSDQTPWGIETIYKDAAIKSTSGGLGVNVAVLDTGITASHPDLKRRIVQCKDFTSFKSPVVDGKCEDKNGHGTHVAGIVAADAGADGAGIYGVAPEANIFAYKVCGPNGSCFADDIAFALRFAADQGAKVVNMSFGSNTSSLLIKGAVEYAASKGVLMVAAAGNDGPFPESIDYPGAYPQVVAVGAINQLIVVTDWSSRGINSSTTPFVVEEKDIEFASPGEHIESTWNNRGYAILSGTSMASPFVAGLAAKYWQANALDPLSATRSFLHSLAIDLLPVGDDGGSGFGLPRVQ